VPKISECKRMKDYSQFGRDNPDLSCGTCGKWDCKTKHRSHWTNHRCFYVTVRDAGKLGVLAGPFRTHCEALEMVEPVKKAAEEVDAFAAFYSFGTIRAATGHHDGVLNNQLGLKVERPKKEELREMGWAK
jgi:hypothetical protein